MVVRAAWHRDGFHNLMNLHFRIYFVMPIHICHIVMRLLDHFYTT